MRLVVNNEKKARVVSIFKSKPKNLRETILGRKADKITTDSQTAENQQKYTAY